MYSQTRAGLSVHAKNDASAESWALTRSTHRGVVWVTFPLLRAHSYTLLPTLRIKSFCIWEFFRILLEKESVFHMFHSNAISANLNTASFLLQCNRASDLPGKCSWKDMQYSLLPSGTMGAWVLCTVQRRWIWERNNSEEDGLWETTLGCEFVSQEQKGSG